MARSVEFRASVSVAELFALFESMVPLGGAMLAVLTSVPVALAATVAVNV